MARVFKKRPENDIWWIEYWVDGRRIRESTKTTNRRVAERALASRLGEIVQGRFKLEKVRKSPRLSEYCQVYLDWAKEHKKSLRRDLTSIKHLEGAFGNKKLSDIHPFHVESYKIRRRSEKTPKGGEVQPGTINRELACLKRMLNLAVQWDMLEYNQIQGVKLFKEPKGPVRFLSEEEAARLIEACNATFRPIVITALNTGMRLNEILTLTWDRVDFRNRSLSLIQTKNDEPRQVPLNQTMAELLKEIPKRSKYVFTSKLGERYHCVKRAFQTATRNAGIENFRFHDLRHTWASHLVMSGVDLLTVKEMGGWKSLEMVQRYAHLSGEHRTRAAETLDGMFRLQPSPKPSTMAQIRKSVAAIKPLKKMGFIDGLYQSVQRPHNPLVVGSSPTGPTNSLLFLAMCLHHREEKTEHVVSSYPGQ